MNIMQAFKMAWKSIWGKKGRSTLTILGIFIGIAAVMTIVSVLEGMKEFTRQQYAAMGSNRISVYIWSYSYDEEGNSLAPDYFPNLYNYCNGMRQYIDGVTPPYPMGPSPPPIWSTAGMKMGISPVRCRRVCTTSATSTAHAVT